MSWPLLSCSSLPPSLPPSPLPSLPPLLKAVAKSDLNKAVKAAELTRKDTSTEREMYTFHSHTGSSSLSFPHSRANLSSEVEFLQNKLEKASLDKSIAEAKVADFEREKKMIELDIQEILVRHKSEVTERMSKFARVSGQMVV